MNSENNEFDLSDFPANKIFIGIDENFRKYLFDKALENSNQSMLELTRKLNLSYKYLHGIKNGFKYRGKRSNIRLNLLNELTCIAKISLSETIKNILFLRYGRNSCNVLNIFPLKYDLRLAALVGHATGDGHIKSGTFNFEYRNSSEELIKKVYDLVFDIFKIECNIYSNKDGTKQVEAPSIVGYVLYKAGAPVGNKIKNRFDIPVWIKYGDKEVIASYLGSLVDDEFCISQSKVMIFSLSKNVELKENLFIFFEEIKDLFLKLNIKSYQKESNGVFIRKDNVKTKEIILNICGQNNFIKFKENVIITNKSKINSLNKLTSSYILKPYDKCGYNKAKEIALSKLKIDNFTTTQLTKETTISRGCFLRHLTRMKKEGLIKEVKRLAYREILWTLNYSVI